jgi:hypothetical protein
MFMPFGSLPMAMTSARVHGTRGGRCDSRRRWRNRPRCACPQIHVGGKGALAELDVARGGVVHPLDPTQLLGGRGAHGFVEGRLDGQFHVVRQLGAARGEEFDAVVLERVVGGGDDHAGLQAQGAGQIGDARGGHRPGQADVDAGRGEPGLQRGFQHVAGNAGVLADQHGGMLAVHGVLFRGGQHLAGGIPQPHGEIRGDGLFADPPRTPSVPKYFLLTTFLPTRAIT